MGKIDPQAPWKLSTHISLTSLIMMVSHKKQTSKTTIEAVNYRVDFVTDISSISLTTMFSPNMINILHRVYHNSYRSKNVRITVVHNQPLSINGMLVIRENKAYLRVSNLRDKQRERTGERGYQNRNSANNIGGGRSNFVHVVTT